MKTEMHFYKFWQQIQNLSSYTKSTPEAVYLRQALVRRENLNDVWIPGLGNPGVTWGAGVRGVSSAAAHEPTEPQEWGARMKTEETRRCHGSRVLVASGASPEVSPLPHQSLEKER